MSSARSGYGRDSQFARQAVPGAGAHDTERRARADELRGDLVDGPVAAPGDHQFAPLRDRLPRQLRPVPRGAGDFHAPRDPVSRERLFGKPHPLFGRERSPPSRAGLMMTATDMGGM